MAQGTARPRGIVADPARGASGPKILHVRLPSGEWLRPRAHRKHGGVGSRACGRALGLRPSAAVLLRPGAPSVVVRGEGMTVIAFQSKALQSDGPWRAAELNAMVESLAPDSSRAGVKCWDVGTTEIGDQQFYLLGAPDDR